MTCSPGAIRQLRTPRDRPSSRQLQRVLGGAGPTGLASDADLAVGDPRLIPRRCKQVEPGLAHRREHENTFAGTVLPDSDTRFEGRGSRPAEIHDGQVITYSHICSIDHQLGMPAHADTAAVYRLWSEAEFIPLRDGTAGNDVRVHAGRPQVTRGLTGFPTSQSPGRPRRPS